MNNNFNVPRNLPIQPTRPLSQQKSPVRQLPGQSTSFDQILNQKLNRNNPLKFSAHAEKRLAMSGIKLSDTQLNLLEEAVNKAEAKGGRESLVVMNDLAFVVSVRNRTVITAIDSDRLKENVFTNIDSAVIT